MLTSVVFLKSFYVILLTGTHVSDQGIWYQVFWSQPLYEQAMQKNSRPVPLNYVSEVLS